MWSMRFTSTFHMINFDEINQSKTSICTQYLSIQVKGYPISIFVVLYKHARPHIHLQFFNLEFQLFNSTKHFNLDPDDGIH